MRTTPLYIVEAETKPIINFPKSPKEELELELELGNTEEIDGKPPPDYQNVGRILGVTRIVGNSLAEYCPDRILLVALGRSTEWPDWNANQPH
ncbi:hypothetical protein WN944_006795 [Citrus x changshan-huyou]|uniref:Uncharacterized protein n=1 Tax=Citrus x changshan-huyou TaxID=2935761 RepID=A0AAP0MJS9_9ROSI